MKFEKNSKERFDKIMNEVFMSQVKKVSLEEHCLIK